MKQIVLLTPK